MGRTVQEAARLRPVRRGRTWPKVYENHKFYDHFREVINRYPAMDNVLAVTSNVAGKMLFTPVHNCDRRRKILWITPNFCLKMPSL